ncbi:MAG: hypothetical protein EBE86_031200 [Hormoscilla sp. GUM202]|nr:hypothetical protein [Hormoscilla sp. GUM202]
MTTEPGNDERLDSPADIVSGIAQTIDETNKIVNSNERLIESLGQKIDETAKIADRNERRIKSLGQKIDETAKIVNRNERVVQALVDAMAEAAAERRENIRLILQQQSEVRDLQIKNYRMWEILIFPERWDRRNQDDNPDA